MLVYLVIRAWFLLPDVGLPFLAVLDPCLCSGLDGFSCASSKSLRSLSSRGGDFGADVG